MDIRAYNREAWNREVERGNPWTLPVSPQQVEAARRGELRILLTPTRFVPAGWFPPLAGSDALCLASGGGQQAPLLAACGAKVTVFDNSPAQLAQDRRVAEREGFTIRLVEGDMRDLSVFANESFDLIVHPVSNVFIPDVLPVWREASRVLRRGGVLLAGFNNPLLYLFDFDQLDQGRLVVRNRLPYSDLTHQTREQLERYMAQGFPLEWSHSLEEQIGGQLAAGLVLTGLFEDIDPGSVLGEYIPSYIATRAVKP
ncbi:MAG: class I SAM-dependent methyltransferase [Chloroflexota bacterium]|jgi:SAM-dependent methyltransferase